MPSRLTPRDVLDNFIDELRSHTTNGREPEQSDFEELLDAIVDDYERIDWSVPDRTQIDDTEVVAGKGLCPFCGRLAVPPVECGYCHKEVRR